MGSAELTEWMAYEQLAGPLGGARADLQAGVIASTVYNMQRGKAAPKAPRDFVPKWDRRKLTPEELWQQATAANEAAGGIVLVRKN